MLTGLAILERELGKVEYELHLLRRRLEARLMRAEVEALRREADGLEQRKRQTLRLLEELNQEYQERDRDDGKQDPAPRVSRPRSGRPPRAPAP